MFDYHSDEENLEEDEGKQDEATVAQEQVTHPATLERPFISSPLDSSSVDRNGQRRCCCGGGRCE